MTFDAFLAFAVPTLILCIAVSSDLRTKKVSNLLNLILFAAALLFHFTQKGFGDWLSLLLSISIAAGLMLPMVAARVIGAGDMKLFIAFAPAVVYFDVIWTFILAILWAGLLGTLMVIMRGELKLLLTNAIKLLARVRPEDKTLHRIPYTVALLFGWLSVVSLKSIGGL